MSEPAEDVPNIHIASAQFEEIWYCLRHHVEVVGLHHPRFKAGQWIRLVEWTMDAVDSDGFPGREISVLITCISTFTDSSGAFVRVVGFQHVNRQTGQWCCSAVDKETTALDRDYQGMVDPSKDVMPKIGGKSFYCDCGCNVFRALAPLRYKCNSCGAQYIGEK